MEGLFKGQKVKIRFKTSSDREEELYCLIRWIEKDRIGMKFLQENMIFAKYLFEGKDIEAVIYSDKGIYIFDSVVIDSPFSVDFVIELPEEKKSIQRREYIRAPLILDAVIAINDDNIKAKTINIGGGGIRLSADWNFKAGDICSFKLFFNDRGFLVSGLGEVLYSIKQEKTMVSVIKFLDIEETDRNRIIKICFEDEAARLKLKMNNPEDKGGFGSI